MALTMISGLGSRGILDLAEKAGSIEDIFSMSPRKIGELTGKKAPVSIDPLSVKRSKEYLEELEYIETRGIKAVSYWDDDYPSSLRDIYDPPVMLYYKGDIRGTDAGAVSIVGARRCSAYGMQMAEKLAFELAMRGITIVSGMARGIDTAAHMGAIKAGGRTIAVMGSGFRNIYPDGSEDLVKMIEANGVVMTEFNSHIEPLRGNFPRRNRIVSGLSGGVVVVEAARKSGALITADLALEQGKEVFAVPGRADSYVSRGTNDLIRSGAKIVTGVEDILEELGIEIKTVSVHCDDEKIAGVLSPKKGHGVNLPEDYVRVINVLKKDSPVHIDVIQENTKVDHRLLMDILLRLEMQKFIKTLPGNNYVLVRR